MPDSASIEFVNHACVIIERGDIRLLCDPWLSGAVFDNGWDHLVASQERIEDLDFTHIWFSHEHPDHFSPSELKRVPEERRKHTPILFQKTLDGKVRDFCARLGYPVIELEHWKPYQVAHDFTVTVNTVGEFDSWLHASAGTSSILNVNDCRLRTPDDLRRVRAATGPIDLLLTQFSYANWAGNAGDDALPEIARRMVREQLLAQLRELAPAQVLPFAGFVRFCHAENAFWNDSAIRIDDAIGWLTSAGADVVVLYPGDRWTVGEPHDNGPALEAWRTAYGNLHGMALLRADRIPIADLASLFSAMQEKVREMNDWKAILELKAAGDLPGALVYLTDYGKAFSYDVVEGFAEAAAARESCDVELSSDALVTVLKQPWGRGTLIINGRFSANYESFWRFDRMTQIPYANNVGKRFPSTLSRDELISRKSFILELMGDAEYSAGYS